MNVSVRPENIRLSPASATRAGHVAATLTDETFLGNIHKYYVTLASGLTLRVQTHPEQRFAIGEAVGVTIDGGLCSIFRRVESVTAG